MLKRNIFEQKAYFWGGKLKASVIKTVSRKKNAKQVNIMPTTIIHFQIKIHQRKQIRSIANQYFLKKSKSSVVMTVP